MCAVVEKIKAEGKAEGRAEGKILQLIELVEKEILSVEVAASVANMTVEEFSEICVSNKLFC